MAASKLEIITSKPFLNYISDAIGIECQAFTRPPAPVFGRENENYFLGIKTPAGALELVLRCTPETPRESRRGYDFDYIRKEYHVLKELERLEFPYRTSKVWGLAEGGLLKSDYFLMERLAGRHLDWGFQPDYGEALIRSYGKAVGFLSNIPLNFSKTITALLPDFSLEYGFSLTEGVAEKNHGGDALMKYSRDWLKARFPRPREKVIAHGDLNPSNILTTGDSISGIIDWENIHITDESLVQVTYVGWIYGREDLMDVFCHEFGRTREELQWHLVRWYFANAFSQEIVGWEEDNRKRLIREIGFRGGA